MDTEKSDRLLLVIWILNIEIFRLPVAQVSVCECTHSPSNFSLTKTVEILRFSIFPYSLISTSDTFLKHRRSLNDTEKAGLPMVIWILAFLSLQHVGASAHDYKTQQPHFTLIPLFPHILC